MIEQLVAPPVGFEAAITQGVARFAGDWKLTLDYRHQDEPIWYVWASETKEDWAIRRFVQVGVFRQDDGPLLLKALGSVTMTNEARGIARVSQRPLGEETFNLDEVSNLRPSETPLATRLEGITYGLAEQAWLSTVKIDDYDLEEVKLPSN